MPLIGSLTASKYHDLFSFRNKPKNNPTQSGTSSNILIPIGKSLSYNRIKASLTFIILFPLKLLIITAIAPTLPSTLLKSIDNISSSPSPSPVLLSPLCFISV